MCERRPYRLISVCQENVAFLKRFLARRILRGCVVFFNVTSFVCRWCKMASMTVFGCNHSVAWVPLYTGPTMTTFLSSRLIIPFTRQDVTKHGHTPRPSTARWFREFVLSS